MTTPVAPADMPECDHIEGLKAELRDTERRERALQAREQALQARLDAAESREQALKPRLDAAESREQALKARLDAAEDRIWDLEVRDLQLTIQSVQKGLDDANTWIQSLELSYLEEITEQLEETALKAQGNIVCKPRDEVAFVTPPLSQHKSWLGCFTFSDCFTSSEFGDSPSVYTRGSSCHSSPRRCVTPVNRDSTILVPETPPSAQGSARLTGQKRPRERTDGEPDEQGTPDID